MKAFVGVTDRDWFDLLSGLDQLEDVNFWQPSGNRPFKALSPGELFLFKLHSPNDYIVGGGFFAHSSLLPISLAWESFGINNGANSLPEIRNRVEKYRRQPEKPMEDYTIGCILIEQPFFFTRESWIPVPFDWKSNIVQGRGYDLDIEPGISLWKQIQTTMPVAIMMREETARYGKPAMTFPRLGQGSFRIMVTDAYDRRCAITNERTLPALDAAHIKPFSENGPKNVSNGILLRRDLHALFDKGYLTITPTYVLEISRKIKEEFENGREYYHYHGKSIHVPSLLVHRPSIELLTWHNTNIFRG
jgi:putative restriction endonuclease